MDLRVLSFCEAVGRCGSFTRAAEEMHVAQLALSMAVAKLEAELGVKLFVRLPRGALPTQEGEMLLARARRVFAEVDSARRELKDLTTLSSGVVRVGFPPMFGQHYLPKLLLAFRRQHPGIEITAIEGSATDVSSKLEAGDIDIGMLESRRVDRRWNSVVIGRDEMVIALRKDHPVGKRPVIGPQELDGLPMVVLSPHFLQRQLLDRAREDYGVQYRKVMESNCVQLTILAVKDGEVGATILRSLVGEHADLVGVPFKPKLKFNFELCWLKDRYLSKANQALLELAKSGTLRQLIR